MTKRYQTLVLILTLVIVLIFGWYYFLGNPTPASKQNTNRSLNPIFPYTRQSLARHFYFKPMTFEQNRDPAFDYKKKANDLVENKKNMDNKEMISIIRNYFIQQPTRKPYNLVNKDLFDYSGGQSATVDNLLKFKINGFYIECCNNDGENTSSTLFFERVRRWNGLVITKESDKFTVLEQKNRKAMLMNSCLSVSGEVERKPIVEKNKQTEVHCFPFYSIMAALQKTNVDFFSLDVNGEDELSILRTIQFTRLNIKMLSIRFKGQIRHYKSEVQLFMEGIGYDTVLKLVTDNEVVHHLILKQREPMSTFDIVRLVLLLVLITNIICFVYLYVSIYYVKCRPWIPYTAK